MLLFGHTGLTTGLALLLHNRLAHPARSNEPGGNPEARADGGDMVRAVDYRVVLVGSLLPDLIDKPLGMVIPSWLGNGRTIGHTLLFALLVTIAGLAAHRKHGSSAILWLAFGSFVHLVFDRMWEQSTVVLWPLFGFRFPHGNPEAWLDYILNVSMPSPRVYVPEILGAMVIAIVLRRIVKKHGIAGFLKHGRLS
ncbi:MAG: metal-dependent hydrolase [Chloroflexi bacterium]|nr:metal-dependent hydrolase [Chloroflexota bacterium]